MKAECLCPGVEENPHGDGIRSATRNRSDGYMRHELQPPVARDHRATGRSALDALGRHRRALRGIVACRLRRPRRADSPPPPPPPPPHPPRPPPLRPRPPPVPADLIHPN